MRKSLRWRLQAWYALVLVGVVGGFAAILYFQVRAARLRALDAELESAAQYLDANLRRFPPRYLENHLFDPDLAAMLDGRPPPPPRPRPGERPPLDGPPPRDVLVSELTLPPTLGERPDGDSPRASYFAVWLHDGSVLKAHELPEDVSPPDFATAAVPGQLRLGLRGEYRECSLLGPFGARILVGRSTKRARAELRAFAWQLAGAGAVVLAVGLAGGWFLSARVLRPLAAISTTASAISAANLSERIDTTAVDRELEELASVLNAMFGRLEAAFERQTRFTADASHELRTPLAILRSHAELALSRPRTPEEYRDSLETCLRATGRMTGLVEALLTLARADAGKLDLRSASFDFKQLVEETVKLFQPLAEAKQVSLAAELNPATVRGDAGRLGQVVTNLLSNAVQYNRPGGKVHVHLRITSGKAVLSVADTGSGIPEADRSHLFERFYRVDKARTRASGGNGLGLAICKSIVEAHRGAIGFESELGRGSTFWVKLPTQSEPDA